MKNQTYIERFMDKISYAKISTVIEYKDTECWSWDGARNEKGYGHFRHLEKTKKAHRYSYEYFVGPIPDGLTIDHLCRVRHCVNPKHLEPVTTQENTARGEAGKMNREKTHCIHGHPFNEENTYRRICQGHWRRDCIECRKAARKRCTIKRRRSGVNFGTLDKITS